MSHSKLIKFRLYIAGEAPNSVQAVANLQTICREHLPERHEIEIVDVVRQPKKALEDGVLLTPTLVRLAPKPVRKIIGNLSDAQMVLQTFGIKVSMP